MFPFSLPGPQFLLFYAALAAVLIFAYRHYLNAGSGDKVRLSLLTDDPYQIAYLRGGAGEAVRVAIVNLLDRGLLVTDGPGVKTAPESASATVRRKLDRAILAACATTCLPRELAIDAGVRAACEDYEKQLSDKGLIVDQGARLRRSVAKNAVLIILIGVAGIRIAQALARGQHNLLFLVILAVVALFIAWRMVGGLASASGRQALSSLQVLMKRVQRQASTLRSGGSTNDALMLASVLGIYALPADAFPFVQQIFPQLAPSPWNRSGDRSSCSSSSCSSSSCSSSSSSCSSSSCGGGGGSGCGGCGGGGD